MPGLGRSRACLHAEKRLYKLNCHLDGDAVEGPGAGAGGEESTLAGMEEDMTTEDDDPRALLYVSKNSGQRRRDAPH